jgi:hypothetical protein
LTLAVSLADEEARRAAVQQQQLAQLQALASQQQVLQLQQLQAIHSAQLAAQLAAQKIHGTPVVAAIVEPAPVAAAAVPASAGAGSGSAAAPGAPPAKQPLWASLFSLAYMIARPRCPSCLKCEHCQRSNNPENLVTCDVCDQRVHIQVLDSALSCPMLFPSG